MFFSDKTDPKTQEEHIIANKLVSIRRRSKLLWREWSTNGAESIREVFLSGESGL